MSGVSSRPVPCEARAGSAGGPAGAEHTASRDPRTHLTPWVPLPARGGRGTRGPSRPPGAQPLRREAPVARPLRGPLRTLRITAAPGGGERGPGAGEEEAPRSRGARRRPALPPSALRGGKAGRLREAPQGARAPEAPEPRPPLRPVPPTWLALWNCFFSPATDIAAAPGRGLGWSPGSAAPRGHDALGERAPGPVPARAGLRRARLPRPRPRPQAAVTLAHTRARSWQHGVPKPPRSPLAERRRYANEASGAAHASLLRGDPEDPRRRRDRPARLGVGRPLRETAEPRRAGPAARGRRAAPGVTSASGGERGITSLRFWRSHVTCFYSQATAPPSGAFG